jgi:hypothetical protein
MLLIIAITAIVGIGISAVALYQPDAMRHFFTEDQANTRL